jgi:hypothetical protein
MSIHLGGDVLTLMLKLIEEKRQFCDLTNEENSSSKNKALEIALISSNYEVLTGSSNCDLEKGWVDNINYSA